MGEQGDAIAAAARRLVGVRFRPQGHEPAYGLDCVGLVLCALRDAGVQAVAPHDYPARGGSPARLAALMAQAGLSEIAVPAAQAGDVLLLAPGAGQLHLAIRSDAGVVHADAGLRRVVERPGACEWPVLGAWRG